MEVSRLKYFKITKSWSIKAESEEEAIKQVAQNPGQYLESETVTRTEYNPTLTAASTFEPVRKNRPD